MIIILIRRKIVMATLKELILKVESEFKTHTSKTQIVEAITPEDIEALFNLVRDNPEEYHHVIRDIRDRTRVLIKDSVYMY